MQKPMIKHFSSMIITIAFFIITYLLPNHLYAETGRLIGGDDFYIVQKDDTLDLIASKLGLKASKIAEDNGIDRNKTLREGMFLRINNRRIVPKLLDKGILINIPERMLYYFKDNRLEMVFPVGLGKVFSSKEGQWHTPTGQFLVKGKQKDPVWYVPASIQREMERQGKPVELIVSPGPDNPLGRFVVRTSIHNIHIHETNQPTSVHKFTSHGCIRVLPQHMEPFFKAVEPNTPGEIIYMPIKVHAEGKRVYLEAHKDYYKKIPDIEDEARGLIEQTGLAHRVDWQKVKKVITDKLGIAVDVTAG